MDFNVASIANFAVANSQNQSLSKVGTALLAMSLDDTKQMGNTMVDMMEHSVNPAVGGNIDIRV